MPRPIITEDPLETVEGRWILRILLRLNNGEHRFSDLKSALPRISSNVLTERIRELERAGLIERHFLPPPAASHVYALTSLGARLRPALEAIESWHTTARESGSSALRKD